MACNAIGNNAKIATYTLRDTGEGWFIEMNFAQAAIDAEMQKIYSEEQLTGIGEDEYKKMFLAYLHAHVVLRVDGEKIPFESGGILLGSHQTDVKYVLPQIPSQPQTMSVYLPMFEEVYKQTNLFRIYRGGGKFTKFFLSADTDFSVNIAFTDEGIVATDGPPPSNRFAMISGGVMLLILALSVVRLVSRRNDSKAE